MAEQSRDLAREHVIEDLTDITGWTFWTEKAEAFGLDPTVIPVLLGIAADHLRKYGRLLSADALALIARVQPDQCVCPVPDEPPHGVPCRVHPDDQLRADALRKVLQRAVDRGLLNPDRVEAIVAAEVPRA